MRRPQIAVIGSASGPDSLMQVAEALGTALVDRGFRVVCGGLSGVMEAVGRGARRSERATGSDVIGILPGLGADSANEFVDVVVPTGMQYARNAVVVSAGDVVVAIGGGSGTLSELALAWQLGKPIVALTSEGGWAEELASRTLDGRRRDAIVEAESVDAALAAVEHALQARPGAPGARGFS